MSNHRFEQHVEIKEPKSAVDALQTCCSLSRQKIKQAMQKGAVWLTVGSKTQRLRRASRQLKSGQHLHLYYDNNVLSQVPAQPVLIEDHGQFSIWFKPSSLLSHGSKWGDHCTLTRWAENHLIPQRPAFLVHRLDRAAQGLMIIGHSKSTTSKLCYMFEHRLIEKHYRAIIHGYFKTNATLSSSLDKKEAISHVSPIDFNHKLNRSLVDVQIETGRKHQVRRHMAESGYPIVGDKLYGAKEDAEDLQLYAYSLMFNCPITKACVKVNIANKYLPTLHATDSDHFPS